MNGGGSEMRGDAVTRAGLSADTAIFSGFAPPPFDSLVNKLALWAQTVFTRLSLCSQNPGKSPDVLRQSLPASRLCTGWDWARMGGGTILFRGGEKGRKALRFFWGWRAGVKKMSFLVKKYN